MPANRIYLDHAATTPVVSTARAAMLHALAHWANPSSPHNDGRKARAHLEASRETVKAALNWDGEVLFTSGASEAIFMGLSGFDSIASAVEHDAVLNAVGAEARLPVDAGGVVQLGPIAKGRRYAIQHVNNETGVVQPLADLGAEIRTGGGLLFADCSQSAGKMALPDADLIAISAHKFGGPPGIGALLLRDLALLRPTGGQEKGYRRGTENLPAVAGLAAALESTVALAKAGAVRGLAQTSRGHRLRGGDEHFKLRENLEEKLVSAGGEVVAADSQRLATIASYRMPGVSASSQLIGFDMAGISVSAGSACSSGTLKTSHVLGAMGWDAAAASEVVRVSFGPETNEADIDRFVATWIAIKDRAQAA